MTKSFIWLERDEPLAEIRYLGEGKDVIVRNVTIWTRDDSKLPQGLLSGGQWLFKCFARRVCPKCRFDWEVAKRYGVTEYNPERICRVSHGVKRGDEYWMKFDTDKPDLCWDDVKLN